jgi:hypothetical protein
MTSRSNAWTAERRALQSVLIRRWRPWERSTGPQTVEGKAISSRNASRPDSITRQLQSINEDLRMVRRMVSRAIKAR